MFDSASQARWRRSCWSISQPRSHGTVLLITHRSADFVAHSEVEAALLVHGVVDAGEFGELRPVVFKGVIQQAVVGAAERNDASNIQPRRDLFYHNFLKKQQQNPLTSFKKTRKETGLEGTTIFNVFVAKKEGCANGKMQLEAICEK